MPVTVVAIQRCCLKSGWNPSHQKSAFILPSAAAGRNQMPDETSLPNAKKSRWKNLYALIGTGRRAMAYLTWDAAHDTGIPGIDYEHRQLVQMLNDIHELIMKRAEPL